jgi:hypothetical protein
VKCYKGKLVPWLDDNDQYVVKTYSILLEGDEICEAEKFYERFENEEEQTDALNHITIVIEQMLQHGASLDIFRPEGGVFAIPKGNYSLRFYCCRLNDNMVVFGNGGIKTSQKVQDSPDCEPHRKFLIAFMAEFEEKIRTKELNWNSDNELVTDEENSLYFEFGDCD